MDSSLFGFSSPGINTFQFVTFPSVESVALIHTPQRPGNSPGYLSWAERVWPYERGHDSFFDKAES